MRISGHMLVHAGRAACECAWVVCYTSSYLQGAIRLFCTMRVLLV
jgi:hypothetical protein